MRRSSQHIGAVALTAATTLAGLAMAACDSGGGSSPDGGEGGAFGHRMSATIPAQIDPRPQTFISSDVVTAVANGWRAGSHAHFTEVDAGALAADRSTGALVIFRHDYLAARQNVNVVEVNRAGPLRITRAPLGRGVEASAQRHGRIEFAGARGVRGTLELSDDTITLRR